MKTIIILALACCVMIISCQKEYSFQSSTNAQPDSTYVLSFMKRTGIEFNTSALGADTSFDYYTYLPGKIVHKAVYIIDNNTDSIQYSYYYDAGNKLIKYENDFNSGHPIYSVRKIKFTYANGKVSEAGIEYFNGQTALQQFSYPTSGRQIIVYDTMPNTFNDAGIMQYHYYLNSDSTIDSVQYTLEPFSPGQVSAKMTDKFSYDNNKNITRLSTDNGNEVITINARDQQGGEIASTIQRMFANLSYHYFMFFATNDALIFNNLSSHTYLINTRLAAQSVTDTYAGSPITNIINNQFDNLNLLKKQTLPDGIGSNAGGPSIFEFSYIKIPK